jgi:BolA family transcriptional regulator, general stress-responsive regulator
VSLAEVIRERLAPLAPVTLEIFDDSAEHAGHAGVRESCGGHFEVLLVSPAFAGKSAVARHRMVYQTVADLIPHRIHALAIRAYAPGEIDGTAVS